MGYQRWSAKPPQSQRERPPPCPGPTARTMRMSAASLIFEAIGGPVCRRHNLWDRGSLVHVVMHATVQSRNASDQPDDNLLGRVG